MIGLLTLLHVGVSLVAIGAGFVWLGLALCGRPRGAAATVFLATTTATAATGFMFPISGFTPALAVGALSLPIIALAGCALHVYRLRAGWRTAFFLAAMTSLYLNSFVLVAQVFQKVPALHALAPTQREAPFACVQLGLLLTFVALSVRLVRGSPQLPAQAGVAEA